MQTGKSPSVTARQRPARSAPEFPGCRAVFLGCDEVASYEGRFEFWDAATETAWMVCDPTSATHEFPSHRLSALSEVIASMRGSAIACFGAMALELRGEGGERRRILQADQSVYLHPGRSRLPREAGMVIGEHDFPDVVVEVDHTTDVRRGKLSLYEEWGFPEVWVEVPERYAPSRPAGRLPGLVIHLLQGRRYRTVPVSRAFPGGTAEEIHTALNEPALSAATGEVLARVGRALGAREGTGPDDMPWLRAQRREGRAEERAQGHVEGLAEGRTEGRREARAETMNAVAGRILAARGMPGFESPLDAWDLARVTDEEVVDALLQCKDESDLRARLRALRRRAAYRPAPRA